MESKEPDLAPVVILVRPQLGENIGAVARAMKNFGLSELRIVAPRDGWPNPNAEAMASGATDILQAATLYEDTASALADITRAYALTARPRDMEKRVVTPQEAAIELSEGKTALMFGPERTGLANEDVAWCDTVVTIPTNPDYSSLNIAQSVVVMGYAWFTAMSSRAQPRDLEQAEQDPSTPLHFAQDNLIAAPLSEYDALFRQLEGFLDRSDFFKVPEKKPGMWLNIKTMLLRGRYTPQEIRTLHGIFRALAEGR